MSTLLAGRAAVVGDVHVGAQSGDSVSTQVERSLSDGTRVTSSCGELAASHFFAPAVKRPMETGST